jgi:plasmid stabilization system protein ParE
MKLRYTDPAADELEECISYFLDHVPSLIADFADSIDAAVAQLVDNPYMAQETEKPGVRRWYIRRFRYSIFYTVEGDEIVILHIRHAARRRPWERETADE